MLAKSPHKPAQRLPTRFPDRSPDSPNPGQAARRSPWDAVTAQRSAIIALMIRSLLLAFVALAPTHPLAAQSLQGPESVEYDYRTGRTYISNKGANPPQILMRAANGSLSVFKQLAGASPHGLRIAGDVLYVATGNTVQGFRLAGAAAVPAITIPGASFLNGMATDGRERLWVSDFSTTRIHQIYLSPSTPSVSTLVAGAGFTPNGLDYDARNNRLLVAGWGGNAKIAEVPLDTGSIAILQTTSLGNLDGIARDCAGNLYVSSWGSGSLQRFDVPLFATPPVPVLTTLAQPSDIRFARHGGDIIVPNFGSSTLSVHPTDCLFGDSFH
jgi:DNA-binding beta-propeller fold protein YncE